MRAKGLCPCGGVPVSPKKNCDACNERAAIRVTRSRLAAKVVQSVLERIEPLFSTRAAVASREESLR